MSTSFITIVSPLTAVLIVVFFLAGLHAGVTVVAAYYGWAFSIPFLSPSEQPGSLSAVVPFAAALFAFARYQQLAAREPSRHPVPGRLYLYLSMASLVIGITVLPYWLHVTRPALWALALFVLTVIGLRGLWKWTR